MVAADVKPAAGVEAAYWCVLVRPKAHVTDGHGRDVLAAARRMGLTRVSAVHSGRLYFLHGCLTQEQVTAAARLLLCDSVTEEFTAGPGLTHRPQATATIEVRPLPGVMDPVALSLHEALAELLAAEGWRGAAVEAVRTARWYQVEGATSVAELEALGHGLLANGCIEACYIRGLGRTDKLPESFPVPPEAPFVGPRSVPLRSLDDAELAKLSRDGHLFLSLDEMRAIRSHFERLERDPTDLELETLAQTWSEHCVHKTLKSAVVHRGSAIAWEKTGNRERGAVREAASAGTEQVEVRFENLLKDTIAAATSALMQRGAGPECLSVFKDNAGIIGFDEEYGIAFKAETHNHPSAIEPYGGAATGVGGCIRDIMGCGLGAKPIANTDVFCLAPPDYDADRLPEGVLHPRRVLHGVVRGVRDYGNRMGIPTVNGAIYFDPRYLANPLVFCGCVGLIPRDRIEKGARPGDYIVVAGGRTGRDGIHGATFSSAELTDTHADEFSHAVQIGNAIEEKKLLDAQLIARDHARGCLYSAVTDCGAGGLSSAVGEMAAQLGAEVDLERVPLKYSGLRYDEIWISEAQERMVFAVPPECLDEFLAVFRGESVEATVIGRFTDDRVLRVRFRGTMVGELDLHFLHEGLPKTTRRATWHRPAAAVAGARSAFSSADLLAALRGLNVASKEWVIRQYDHEVQSRSTVKPLTGPGSGPSDAAVLRPRLEVHRGIAIGCGLRPELTEQDPYLMAVAAVDEALRNVICVGADPDRVAILDNFCWGKVDREETLGELVRACCGARDAALAYRLPFISGKDSLNNEFVMSEVEARRTGLPPRIAIPGTLLISALGIVEDVRRCVTMDLKRAGSVLVLASAPVEAAGLEAAYALHRRVAELIQSGNVLAAHDVSDGGLAVAVAEMAIAGGSGARVTLDPATYPHHPLAVVGTTYVLEMQPAAAASCGLPVVGEVTVEPRVHIEAAGKTASLTLSEATAAWKGPLAEGG